MSLKKLSIDDTQREVLEDLASKGLSSYKIAKKMKLSQCTVWRNLELLGLNKKRKHEINFSPKKDEMFNWGNFKNSLI